MITAAPKVNRKPELYSDKVYDGEVDDYDEVQRLKAARKNRTRRGKSKSMVEPSTVSSSVSKDKKRLAARGKAMSMVVPGSSVPTSAGDHPHHRPLVGGVAAAAYEAARAHHYKTKAMTQEKRQATATESLTGLTHRRVQEDAKAKWTATEPDASVAQESDASTTDPSEKDLDAVLSGISSSLTNYKRPAQAATGATTVTATEERQKRLEAMKLEHQGQQSRNKSATTEREAASAFVATFARRGSLSALGSDETLLGEDNAFSFLKKPALTISYSCNASPIARAESLLTSVPSLAKYKNLALDTDEHRMSQSERGQRSISEIAIMPSLTNYKKPALRSDELRMSQSERGQRSISALAAMPSVTNYKKPIFSTNELLVSMIDHGQRSILPSHSNSTEPALSREVLRMSQSERGQRSIPTLAAMPSLTNYKKPALRTDELTMSPSEPGQRSIPVSTVMPSLKKYKKPALRSDELRMSQSEHGQRSIPKLATVPSLKIYKETALSTDELRMSQSERGQRSIPNLATAPSLTNHKKPALCTDEVRMSQSERGQRSIPNLVANTIDGRSRTERNIRPKAVPADPLGSSSHSTGGTPRRSRSRSRPTRTKRDSLSVSEHSGTYNMHRNRSQRDPLSIYHTRPSDRQERHSLTGNNDQFPLRRCSISMGDIPSSKNLDSTSSKGTKKSIYDAFDYSMSDLDLPKTPVAAQQRRATLSSKMEGLAGDKDDCQGSPSEMYNVFDFSLSSIDPSLIDDNKGSTKKALYRRNTVGNLSVAYLAAARARTRRARAEVKKESTTTSNAGVAEATKIQEKKQDRNDQTRQSSLLSQRRASLPSIDHRDSIKPESSGQSRRNWSHPTARRRSNVDRIRSVQNQVMENASGAQPKVTSNDKKKVETVRRLTKIHESFKVASSEASKHNAVVVTACPERPKSPNTVVDSEDQPTSSLRVRRSNSMTSLSLGVRRSNSMTTSLFGLKKKKKKKLIVSPYSALDDSESSSELQTVSQAIKLNGKPSEMKITPKGDKADSRRRPSELEVVSQAVKAGGFFGSRKSKVRQGGCSQTA